jgi:hypothetical protein
MVGQTRVDRKVERPLSARWRRFECVGLFFSSRDRSSLKLGNPSKPLETFNS